MTNNQAAKRTDMPTRPTVFFRGDSFYVVLTYEDDGFTQLAEHARLNPETTRIEDMQGNILWRPQ